MATTVKLKNINLLTKSQYDSSSKATDELWAIESPVVIETYQNGTSWYRVYSDGWCEQGGFATGTNVQVNLLKSFKNTSYNISGCAYNSDGGTWGAYFSINSNTKTTSSFVIAGYANLNMNWQACGYVS